MGFVWLFSGGGCLFLWAGLSLNNIELVIGGLFINAILAVILLHNILTRHHSLKETKDEKTPILGMSVRKVVDWMTV